MGLAPIVHVRTKDTWLRAVREKFHSRPLGAAKAKETPNDRGGKPGGDVGIWHSMLTQNTPQQHAPIHYIAQHGAVSTHSPPCDRPRTWSVPSTEQASQPSFPPFKSFVTPSSRFQYSFVDPALSDYAGKNTGINKPRHSPIAYLGFFDQAMDYREGNFKLMRCSNWYVSFIHFSTAALYTWFLFVCMAYSDHNLHFTLARTRLK